MRAPDVTSVRQLGPSLYLIADICNVYVLKRGERAILIDSGMGMATEVLDQLGIKQVEWVLHTHFHRDQCDGTAALAQRGAKVAVPRAEAGYFDNAEGFWQSRGIYDNYNTYNDFFAPTANLPIDRTLADYEVFSWRDVELRVLPTPGHTKGSITLLTEVDGQRLAFVGDVLHHSARVWTLFDLEWAYGQQTGVAGLSLALQTLAALEPDLLLPSHGEPVTQPAAACMALHRKLAAYYQWLQLTRNPTQPGYPLLPGDSRLQPLTPHLWANTTAVANSYTLVADDGAAMFLDYGFPSASHFAANYRFAEHSLDELRRVAGLKRIDVVLPSHYHYDHVCGLQYLYTKHGAQLWVFENQADLLAHPEGYKVPCLWAQPMTATRVFGEGESFTWRGTTFTATKTPGHTEYHCALRFEVDGRRIAYVGDTLARAPLGPRFGGPIFQNGFRIGDFVQTVPKLRDFAPEFMLTGHWGVQQVEPAFFDEALARARSLDGILWGLLAVPEEAGFALDPNWATLYPYQATVHAGTQATISVRVVNHLNRSTVARAQLRLPTGWQSEPSEESVVIGHGEQGELRFSVAAPATAAAGKRHIIAATVALDERRFGPVAEGIVGVVALPEAST